MSEMDEKSSAPSAEMMGGAKRKNGHKSTCSCHICENMKNKARRGGYRIDAQKAALKKSGGSRKKNGHSPTCGCPICKNMKNAKKSKRGGDGLYPDEPDIENQMGDVEEGGIKATPYSQEDDSSIMDSSSEEMLAGVSGGSRKRRGSRKSNGHKPGCGCPICKNMKKKSQKGGDDVAIMPAMPAEDEEYDALDKVPPQSAGTKKRRGNGHKPVCGCPFCKILRVVKGPRRKKKQTHKRR
jgi:hypothetical protein